MSLLAGRWWDVATGAGLLAAALATTALLLALLGANPLLAYGDIIAGAFGSVSGLTEDLV